MRSSSTPQAQGYAALTLLSQISPCRKKELEGSKKRRVTIICVQSSGKHWKGEGAG